ncbi:MAG: DNA-directed RNA polymerase subunit alpha [Kiritimatiellia bacterium]|jgi:DNA-directed RNA polymerase subunit alpha
MPIRLNKFEMPKRVLKDEASATPKFGRYLAEPFEIGYARTIGNSLRRVLLSSIEGVAVSAVRIQGANHEFCSLPGVAEDVTMIILALKKVLVKAYTRTPPVISIKRKGPCVITAGDLAVDNSIEILNPDHPIATVNADGVLDMDLYLSIGRGFCPAEWEEGKQQEIGIIPIDRIYSPVTRVNFDVGNTRVGQHTDYEKLTLEITTDGRIDPDEALVAAAAIMRHHLDVFVGFNTDVVEDEITIESEEDQREALIRKLNMSVNEIELSVRAANCLNNANITTVGELALKTEAEMLKYRNFGKKSLNEIKEKLKEMGLGLGFKFDPELLQKPVEKS